MFWSTSYVILIHAEVPGMGNLIQYQSAWLYFYENGARWSEFYDFFPVDQNDFLDQ